MSAKQTESTGLTIKTNNQPRRLLFTCEFNDTERTKLRQDYDWMDEDEFETNCFWFKYQAGTTICKSLCAVRVAYSMRVCMVTQLIHTSAAH